MPNQNTVEVAFTGTNEGLKAAAAGSEQVAKDAAARMGLTWKQFVAERMSEYMKMEGSHAAAMKRMSEEWKAYKASGVQAQREVAQESASLGNTMKSLVIPIGGIISVYALGRAVKEVVSDSLGYLAKLETANLGIASSFMLGGKYVDQTTGKVLQGQQAMNAAQADAREVMQQLQVANMQTIATLDELVRGYQETLPVAMAKGFNRQQVMDFTVAMVQAAGAIGLPLNQLAQETRSLLIGDINPRDSRIATVLGLRNEDIRQHSANAEQLFNFLMTKLDAYRIAGLESQKTWAGLTSNFRDIQMQGAAQAFEPLFEAVKYELTEITSRMIVIDEKTKAIKWNPEFIDGVQSIKSGINSMIAEAYRFGMLLDKAGGTMTTIGYIASGGSLTSLGKWFDAQNQMFQKRYNDSDKALQALADREVGLAKDTAQKVASTYQQNKPGPDADALKRAEKERKRQSDISMIMAQARERDLVIGKEKDDKELIQLDLKQAQEIKKLLDLHASKAQIEEARRLQKKERDDLFGNMVIERAHSIAAAEAQIAQQNFQAQAAWQDKLDAYKLKTGKISEEEALANKYDRERQGLALAQQRLEVDIEHEKDLVKRNALEAEYWRLLQQVNQSHIEESNDLSLIARKEQEAAHSHQQRMLDIMSSADVSRLQFIGDDAGALDAQYSARRAQIESQYAWELEQAGQNKQAIQDANNKYAEQDLQNEQQYSLQKAQMWWNSAQTYMQFAQQMTTFGVQMLMADESQRGQIGRRMLATAIRFMTQQLQQFMFHKAMEHVLNAASAAGKTATDVLHTEAQLTQLEILAGAWAAFYAAQCANPIGAAIFGASAGAMTFVATAFIPGAMVAAGGAGATSIGVELGMAALWAAGGIAVGAIGEGVASSIEGGASGTPGNPIATTPGSPAAAGAATSATPAAAPSPIINVHIYGEGSTSDWSRITRDYIYPELKKAIGDGKH